MKYLLDTNTCIRYINGRAPKIRKKMLQVDDNDIVVSSITKAEMFSGSEKSQYPKKSRAKQDAFFVRFQSLPFDDFAANHYAIIRSILEKAGTPIGSYDMQIASIAIAHNLIVVTHNTREFSRITGLQLDDWE